MHGAGPSYNHLNIFYSPSITKTRSGKSPKDTYSLGRLLWWMGDGVGACPKKPAKAKAQMVIILTTTSLFSVHVMEMFYFYFFSFSLWPGYTQDVLVLPLQLSSSFYNNSHQKGSRTNVLAALAPVKC